MLKFKKMKKYFNFMAFAMVAVFSLTFISCGNDDDKDEPNSKVNSDLVGTWKGLSISTSFNGVDGVSEEYIQMKDDGTYVYAFYDDEDGFSMTEGKWYVKEDRLYIRTNLFQEYGDMQSEDMTISYRIVELKKQYMTIELMGIVCKCEKVADSEMEAFVKKYNVSGAQLTVNGVVWEASNEHANTFSANDLNGTYDYYWMLNTTFNKKPTRLEQEITPDVLTFKINSVFIQNGQYVKITEGMDITNTDNFNWVKDGLGGNCCEVILSENMFQVIKEKPWVHGTYTQVISGHAYIKKIENDKTLTIQFANLKLKLQEGYNNSYLTNGYENTTPETLLLNGTITYQYKKG